MVPDMPTPLRQVRVDDELWEAFNASLPAGENASSMIRQLIEKHIHRNDRAQRRVKIEAAKLRTELDKQLGRETPAWVHDVANQ